jgi:hypothetical protein
MQFISSRPDVVRSSSQRALLRYWNALRGSENLPGWPGIDAAELAPLLKDLSQNDVVTDNGAVRFLIRFHGTRVAELYGRENCVGMYLDEILSAAYVNSALTTFRQVVASQLPVYTVADMRDPAGRIVHYERLLLPFSTDGKSVDRILISLETVSPEGAFESRGLMKAPPRPPAFALCTTIKH